VTKSVAAVPARRPDGRRESWPVRLVAETVDRAWHDRILGLSAEAAFWQLLSVPPLILALLGGLGYIGERLGHDTVARIEQRTLTLASGVAAPDVVDTVIRTTLDQVLERGRADVVSIGFLISLWAGSSAMATFVNTITIAYGMRDLRGAVRSRLLALWLYLVSIAGLSVLLPLLVIGPAQLRRSTPAAWRHVTDDLIQIGYWPIVGGLLLFGLAALYHYATPVKLRWRRALPGAAIALLVFILGSYCLRLYVRLVVGRALTYGALATPIAALLFFYVLALAVLLGAEVNATLERLWPRGAKPSRTHRLRARLTPNGGSDPALRG
jgi:membrane protein